MQIIEFEASCYFNPGYLWKYRALNSLPKVRFQLHTGNKVRADVWQVTFLQDNMLVKSQQPAATKCKFDERTQLRSSNLSRPCTIMNVTSTMQLVYGLIDCVQQPSGDCNSLK